MALSGEEILRALQEKNQERECLWEIEVQQKIARISDLINQVSRAMAALTIILSQSPTQQQYKFLAQALTSNNLEGEDYGA